MVRPTTLKPGDRMADGTVYAGISPDTGKPMYTTPTDAPMTMKLTMKWQQAMAGAKGLDAHGRKDWRVPTQGELNVLFENHACIGGFEPGGGYWSSTEHGDCCAVEQIFTRGTWVVLNKFMDASLRCVRG